jgi:hypothetical protein
MDSTAFYCSSAALPCLKLHKDVKDTALHDQEESKDQRSALDQEPEIVTT